jgi:hypothetical protein
VSRRPSTRIRRAYDRGLADGFARGAQLAGFVGWLESLTRELGPSDRAALHALGRAIIRAASQLHEEHPRTGDEARWLANRATRAVRRVGLTVLQGGRP